MKRHQSPTWPAAVPVLIPVYNHGQQLAQVLTNLLQLGAPIVVVDDGSTDNSADVARDAGVILIQHHVNRGKAAALTTGMHYLAKEGWQHALTCDADGQHFAVDAWQLARLAAHNSNPRQPTLIIGHRHMPHAPWRSRLGRWWSNTAGSILAGQPLRDSQSGLRVYPLPATLQLPSRRQGFAFEIEVLVLASWAGIRLRSHAVSVWYGSERVSHFQPLRDTVRAIGCLGDLARRRWHRQPLEACQG